MKGTLAKEWAHVKQHLAPEGCSTTQLTITKRSFYAGAMVTLSALIQVADMKEEDGVQTLEALRQEVLAYKKTIGTPEEIEGE